MNKSEIQKLLIGHLKENLSPYKENMIKRYVDFVFSRNYDRIDSPIEKHHILPKSIYPEYLSFINFPWNKVNLSYREHIIAHIMLHHIFGGKMTFTVLRMVGKDRIGLFNRQYDKIKREYFLSEEQTLNSRKGAKVVADKLKEGKRIYYDVFGKSYGFLSKDDPLIFEMNLTLDRSSNSQLKQRETRSIAASKANTGTSVYNDGSVQKKFKEGDDIPKGWVKGGLSRDGNYIRKFDWRIKENTDLVMSLLEKYEGDLGLIGAEIGISGQNVMKNMRKYMAGINHHTYWPPRKRYKVDRLFAEEVYDKYDGNYEEMSVFLGSNAGSIEHQYKKLWSVTFEGHL